MLSRSVWWGCAALGCALCLNACGDDKQDRGADGAGGSLVSPGVGGAEGGSEGETGGETFELIRCQTEQGEPAERLLGGAPSTDAGDGLDVDWVTQMTFAEEGPHYYASELRDDGSLLSAAGDFVFVIRPGARVETLFVAPKPEYGSNLIELVPGGRVFELNRNNYFDDAGTLLGLHFRPTEFDPEGSVYEGYLGWTPTEDGSALLASRGTSDTKSDFIEGYSLFDFDGELLMDEEVIAETSAKAAPQKSGLALLQWDTVTETSTLTAISRSPGEPSWASISAGDASLRSLVAVSLNAEHVLAWNQRNLTLLREGQILWTAPVAEAIWDAVLSDDGSRLLFTQTSPARFHVFTETGPLFTVGLDTDYITTVDLRADGTSVIATQDRIPSADTHILVHDRAGRLKLSCTGPPDTSGYRPWVRFSPNGEFLLMIVNGGLGVLRLN